MRRRTSSSKVPADIFADVGGVETEVSVDPAPGADRRVLVPLRVSVRVRRAALEPHARDGCDERRPRRVRGAGPADARRSSPTSTPIDVKKLDARPERRRWLGLLARHADRSVRDDAGRPGARRREGARPPRDEGDARSSRSCSRRRTRSSRRPSAARDGRPYDDLARGDRAGGARGDRPRRARARPSALHATAHARSTVVSRRCEGARCSRSSRSNPSAQAMRTKLRRRSAVGRARDRRGRGRRDATSPKRERLLLVSDNQTTALVLDALIREDPKHPLIAEARARPARMRARTAAGARRRRTSSCCRRCAATSTRTRRTTPNYTGKLWVGDVAYAEQAFAGRTNVRGDRAARLEAARAGHDARGRARRRPGRAGCTTGSASRTRRSRSICRRSMPASSCGAATSRSTTRATSRRRRPALQDQARRARPGRRSRRSTRRSATASRSSIRCRPGFEAVNTSLATAERARRDR